MMADSKPGMDGDELRRQFDAINVWKRGDQRAPHKPLLLLIALAAVQRGDRRLLPYAEIQPRLRQLLIDFGPMRKSYHPEFPFWRLQNDGGFWEIPEREELIAVRRRSGRKRSGDVPNSLLLENNAHGGFSRAVYETLRTDPVLVDQLAAQVLEAHFPASYHDDILDAVGMPWTARLGPGRRPARDPAFRDLILRNYEYRCAVCGYDGRMGQNTVGLEAAHVKWHAYGGPDSEDNGLALCVLHHRLLDRGAIGIDEEHRVLVSREVHGFSESVQQTILRFAHQPLRPPQSGTAPVAEPYLHWHQREVFRPPART